LAVSPTDPTLVADIKEKVINYLMKKYFGQSDFDELINIASFLDPRVKTKHLEDQNAIKQFVVEGTELIESGAVDVDDHAVVLV